MITRITKPDRVVDTRMNFLIDEIEAEIGKYSNFDLYLKSGGVASATKPTGSGTLVNFSNLTTTEQLAFEFNYTLPSQVVISKDNRYFFNLPFKGLETNRGYIFRAVLMVGTNQLVNHTEPAFTPTSTDFTVKFEKINEQVVDLTIPAGQIVNLKIYVKLASGTDTLISMLVNDISDSARVSRNELVTEGLDKVGDLTTLTTTNKTNAVNAINELNSLKATKSTIVNFTLLASAWINGSYTLTISGITDTSNQELLPSLTISAEQLEALQTANIVDSSQSLDTIVIKAFGIVPTIDIPIRIIKRGD